MILDVFIPGIPKPAGSKRAALIPKRGGGFVTRPDGRPVIGVRDDCETSKDWKGDVKYFVRQHYDGPLLAAPLHVEFEFYFTRPKGHFGTGRNAFMVKESAPPYPAKKPDTTKLVRCAEDALTGVVWIDDAQIVSQVATKRFADKPGMRIRVRSMQEAGIDAVRHE